ncbi:MAG: AAA family ATPase, partial [Oscillospiraceae bacterium]|nr:AAA family ATPase [Oscillospiraceae bacterium]
MGKVIMFASGKGGTGKTTAVSAIGSQLSLQMQRVICVDADPLGGLDLAFGAADECVWNLADAVAGNCKLSEALVTPKINNAAAENLRYCRLGNATDKLTLLTRHLSRRCDWVLIDSPSGITDAPRELDALIMVVNTDQSYYRAAAQIRERIAAPAHLLIVNRVKEHLLTRFNSTLDDAIDEVGAKLIG